MGHTPVNWTDDPETLLAHVMMGGKLPSKTMYSFRFDRWMIEEARSRVGKRRVTALLEELLLEWLERERKNDKQRSPARARVTPPATPL